ncbi:Blastula protease 10 [Folsomia candida]|uniref:Blastula protease 10 n=1 Tax=Folsomia candida TaxID=158441 RepID=A0A226DAF1_FOLCA|nr:Blastula protease 10 [Folsomia candida]
MNPTSILVVLAVLFAVADGFEFRYPLPHFANVFIIFWDGISSKMGVVGHGVTVMTPAVKEVEFFLAPFLDVVLGGDFKNCHHFDVRIAHDRVDDAKVENSAPQPNQERPEDPEPIVTVKTCGGDVNATSASIEFQLWRSIRADMRCVWIVRGPYLKKRFNLIASGLKETDGIYLSAVSYAGLGNSLKLSRSAQNVTIDSEIVIISLIVGHAPTLGFKMEFYSSGASSTAPDKLSCEILTSAKGNVSYPRGGGRYGRYELALFPIAPSVPRRPTLRFTRVDLQASSNCRYDDAIMIYNWSDGRYVLVTVFCGNTIPASVTFQDGAGLVLFQSDLINAGTGFEFQYE